MNIKSICKIGVVLFGITILSQLAYSDCSDRSILPFIDRDKSLHETPDRHTTRTGKEICIYQIKHSRKVNAYYMYTLLDEVGAVVYCGITDDPQERTRAHVRGDKIFNQMIALGYFTKDAALDKEKMCVCEYHPVLNKLPTCAIAGGGESLYDGSLYQVNGESYLLELE